MGSKGSTTTTSKSSLPKEFLTGYTNALKMAGQAVSTPYEAYQGQLVAGLNPTQLQGISNVNAAQGMALPAISQGMDLTKRASEGITPELYNQFYSPYVRDVADATQKNLLETQAQQTSGLKSGAIQAGAFGGDRGGVAQAEMARQQDLAAGQVMSNIYNQGYGQAMGLAGQQAQNYGAMGQQLAGLGLGAQGSVLQGAQAQLAAGAQQQSTEQAQLQAAYDQYLQRLAYPYQQAQFYANIAEGLGSTAGGSTSTTTPGPSWGSQILGGLGAIGSIFSDERVKENIEPVGQLNDGQTIYRYNYKGDPKTRIGLIAQEVEKRNPDAVTDIGGIKGVNYHDATDEAASMGGLVGHNSVRMGFAEGGGMPFYPYGNSAGWVPEGKIGAGGGLGFPEKPPKYDPTLDEDWYGLKPLSEDQLAGLGKIKDSVGQYLGNMLYEPPGPSADFGGPKSHGGLVGHRSAYARGGSDEDPYIDPAADGGVVPPEGFVVEPERRSGLAGIFAGEGNPSIIERVMGRDLSPEARNAVMNASFALLAGRSPYFGVNLGEAGKIGMNSYYNALAQKRETLKQQADLQRQGFEAETGRKGVNVQQATAIIPLIRSLISLGEPVPEVYMRMLEDAFPQGSPMRESIDREFNAAQQSAPPKDDAVETSPLPGPAVPTAPSVPDVPSPDVAATGPTPIPAPSNTESIDGGPASTQAPEQPQVDPMKAVYANVPDSLNPYYWDRMAKLAKSAGDADEFERRSARAAAIRQQDMDRGYVMVNGQRVPIPGFQEQKTADIITQKGTEAAVDATNAQTVSAHENLKSFQSANNSLESAAKVLAKAETGQFSDAKSYIVTALKSLGVPSDAEAVDKAKDIQELRKVFSNILFSGGLKEKIGSQIAASELDMFAKGFGDVNLEPGANRYIVGTMRGLLAMENKRAQDWVTFINQQPNNYLAPAQIAQWEADWNKNNPVSNFVQTGIGQTPVAGEVNWDQFARDPEYRKYWAGNFTKGYQYVMPDGKVKVYTGRREDKYFAPVAGAN